MPNTNTLTSIFTAIANAIRGKNGSSDTYQPADMAAAITAIPSGGSVDWSNFAGISVRNPSSPSAVDLRFIDTSGFTTLYQMCNGCSNITSLDVSTFNTSNVTTMFQAFGNCSGLTQLDLSNFDTSNVTIMAQMFYGCSSITHLDLSNFDTPRLTNINAMFRYCTNLDSVNLSNIYTNYTWGALTTTMSYLFRDDPNLTTIIWSQKDSVQNITVNPNTDFVNSSAIFYVPDNLLSQYKSATNWSTIASRIKGISDLPQQYKTLYNIS